MKRLKYIFIFFLALQAFADRYDALVLGPRDFLEKMPFKESDLKFNSESVRSLRFLENTQKEIDFSGKLGTGNELYLNGVRIPTTKSGQFKFSLSFLDEEQKQEIKLVKPGISETSLFFRLKTIKEFPAPIRAVFKMDATKTVTKSSVFTGKFPSADWIQFSNIEPVEKTDPAFLAKQERDRLEKERIEKELQEKARLEQERLAQEKLEKELQEKARLEQERLAQEKREKERLIQEQLDKEREEQERLAKEKQDKEDKRTPAAETPRIGETEEAFYFKEPKGLELEQGLSFFSLTQAGNPKVSSMNLQVSGNYKTPLFENFELLTQAQIYVFPLSVTGAQEGPRLLRASGSIGWKLKSDSETILTPHAGFLFQTLLTQIEIGYRNVGGPSLGLSYESPVGRSLFLHSDLSFNLFSSDTQMIAFSNNQLGFRLFLEWRKSSSFFSSYYMGVEYQTLSITLTEAQLSSSNTSLFFGLRF